MVARTVCLWRLMTAHGKATLFVWSVEKYSHSHAHNLRQIAYTHNTDRPRRERVLTRASLLFLCGPQKLNKQYTRTTLAHFWAKIALFRTCTLLVGVISLTTATAGYLLASFLYNVSLLTHGRARIHSNRCAYSPNVSLLFYIFCICVICYVMMVCATLSYTPNGQILCVWPEIDRASERKIEKSTTNERQTQKMRSKRGYRIEIRSCCCCYSCIWFFILCGSHWPQLDFVRYIHAQQSAAHCVLCMLVDFCMFMVWMWRSCVYGSRQCHYVILFVVVVVVFLALSVGRPNTTKIYQYFLTVLSSPFGLRFAQCSLLSMQRILLLYFYLQIASGCRRKITKKARTGSFVYTCTFLLRTSITVWQVSLFSFDYPRKSPATFPFAAVSLYICK